MLLGLGTVASAPAAAAPTDSPVLIRTLSAGTGPEPAAEYVMLQMTVDGQGDVAGETLDFYGPDGSPTGAYEIPAGVPSGVAQRTILLATPEAAALPSFPAPDFGLDTGDALSAAGGAVCLSGDYPADCVAWGSFPGPSAAALPDPTGTPAAPVASLALGRSDERGCGGWIDPDDDLGPSAADFFDGVVPPGSIHAEPQPSPPRNNAQQPLGAPCQVSTGLGGFPANPTNQPVATFGFSEFPREYGARFHCRFGPSPLPSIASLPFEPCPRTGFATPALADGLYRLEAFAEGQVGPDTTPVSWDWEVDTVPPETSVTSTPPPISNGFSASFSFASSETHSSFQCQLENGPIGVCVPGQTYFNLADGPHLFRVWAIDQATNRDPTPAAHAFHVDTSFGDVFPPHTTLLRRPPARSSSTSAFFTYASSEPRSIFRCSLDEGAFELCPLEGASYAGLRNGRHAFAVRAVDPAGNADPTPVTYAWTVRGPLPQTSIVRGPPGVSALRGRQRARRVAFAFRANRPGASFRCRVGKRKFRPCRSPYKLRARAGRHRFEVYAIDALGNVDETPARRIFRIRRPGGDNLFGGGLR